MRQWRRRRREPSTVHEGEPEEGGGCGGLRRGTWRPLSERERRGEAESIAADDGDRGWGKA